MSPPNKLRDDRVTRSPWYRSVLLLLVGAGFLVRLDSLALGDVTLAPQFGDHAVLQRDQALEIWGWAEPDETVEVELLGNSYKTQADQRGAWRIETTPLPLTTEPFEMRVRGNNELLSRNLLVGDVWLCSGQSNMDFPMGACDVAEEIQAADHPQIRHFRVAHHFANSPRDKVQGDWQVCSPQTAAGFSAVAFFFAKRVHKETGVPIGLLVSSVGGTNIECWMSQETLLNTPELEPYANLMRTSLAQYQRELIEAIPRVEAWTEESRRAIAAGTQVPLPPEIPEFPFGEKAFRPRCVTLHNGMIAPLIGMRLKGVLWYQGENNAGGPNEVDQYIIKKRAMINDWRRFFDNPELPFYFVQLAAWQNPSDDPGHTDGWAYFRDAQRRCLEIPGTGMASAIDVGDAADIHPKNKADVGQRLALWALKSEYGKELVVSGPLFRELSIEGSIARLHFDQVGTGLMVGAKMGTSPTIPTQDPLHRFAIAGEDRRWYWASARIDGDTVVVSHPEVSKPVAIRYAFDINPEGANLYNRDGLPASPFRTDDW